MLRKVTPPEYSAYLVKIPPNKKEAFLANIDLARAQFPAASALAWSREDSGDYSRSRSLTRERSRPAATSSWTQASKNGGRRQVAQNSKKPQVKAAVVAALPPKSATTENPPPPPPVRTAGVVTAPKVNKTAKALTVAKAKPAEAACPVKPGAAPLTASILGSSNSKDKKEVKTAKAGNTGKTSSFAKANDSKTTPEAKKKNGTTLARKPESSNKKKNSL